MARSAVAKKAAPEFKFAVGDKVEFVKYGETPADGDELFKPGDVGEIVGQVEIGSDDQGEYQSYDVQNVETGAKETLYFPGEVKAASAKATKAAAKTAAKPAAKAAAKPEAVETAKPARKARAEKAEAATEGQGDEAEALILTPTVERLVEGNSALEAAKELQATVSTSYFSLGGVLAFIQETGAYKEATYKDGRKTLHYDDFLAYAQKELALERSKSYQLIRIYRSLSAAGVDEERFKDIGWTYARKMAQVITDKNADKLLTKARTMSRDDFEDYVDETFVTEKAGKAGTDVVKAEKIKRKRYNFAVHGDQTEILDRALARLAEQLGTDEIGPAVVYMATQYMQEQGQTTLEDDMALVEQTHNVKLEVVEEEAAPAPKAKAASAKRAAKATAKA